MIKTVLVDHEVATLSLLSSILKDHFDDLLISGTAKTGQGALELINKTKPDLVFFETDIPGQDCFALLEAMSDVDFKLIFTSSSDQFALKAIKFSALDYLIKPFRVEDVVNAVDKFHKEERKIVPFGENTFVQNLLYSLKDTISKSSDTIALPTAQSIIYAKLNDIIYIKAENNYSAFHMANNETILISYTLKTYEELLKGSHFFRVHNSYIINLKKIRKILRGKMSHAIMEDGNAIEISPKRKESLLQALNTPFK